MPANYFSQGAAPNLCGNLSHSHANLAGPEGQHRVECHFNKERSQVLFDYFLRKGGDGGMWSYWPLDWGKAPRIRTAIQPTTTLQTQAYFLHTIRFGIYFVRTNRTNRTYIGPRANMMDVYRTYCV